MPIASKYAQPPFLLRKNQTGFEQMGHDAFGSSGGGFHVTLTEGLRRGAEVRARLTGDHALMCPIESHPARAPLSTS